ncbi:MAG: hypothetical protein EI684_20110 [Candidatus Viridilinea halotolerans]|uniref:CopG family transcriptional regulator n=1 Tax=Candidatus Viridilinea halotolerans TaxID=2491704 RepID=A0A426TSB5_9CHLR|nr:MAG: hypothetical protein EI684_20110 [Candidatus Viridilinea halotolerans]
MSQPDFPSQLNLRPRPSRSLQIEIPVDVYASLERVATGRDMDAAALAKLYIGQGLRQELAQHFAQHVLDLTAQVLVRHGQSPEQVAAILHEIRSGSTV